MLEKGRISPLQLTVFVILFSVGTTILLEPTNQAEIAQQAAWISTLLGVIVSVLVAWFYVICARNIGDQSYVQYLQKVYGNVIGKFMILCFIFFGFIGTTTLLFHVGTFVSTHMLPETPIEVLIAMFGFLIYLATRGGLEVLARCGELLLPWFLLLFIAMVVFITPKLEFERLTPLFDVSIKQLASGAFEFVSVATFPLVVFLMFFPKNVSNLKKVKHYFLGGMFLGGFFVFIAVLLSILVLGADSTARQMYPSYVLAKSINVGDIITRIEVIMAGMWMITIFFKMSLYFYATTVGLAEFFNLQTYRPIVLPIVILAVGFSTIIYPNVAFMSSWDSKYWAPYAFTMGVLFPLLTLIVDKLRNPRKNQVQQM
ncbi:GerAB/ArcD/ProY family transporter [Alkalihalobacillus sp. 1P02AB]|uniref:GerAB/ArcD/ProY family transporter n=1 Tax=Alkalihalobacillus sp. 1P02AB TaxID=3132260 RepID=UPI0039A77789